MSRINRSRPAAPAVSFIMPCYNEEAIIGYTIPRLLNAFEQAGYTLQLVAVDNGSTDRTGEIIRDLAAQTARITPCRVERNQGYGYGVISGIPHATAPWVGIIPADGQVDAEDVVRLYEAVVASDGWVLGKVRRRFRMDGWRRKLTSTTYNVFFRLLWPRIDSLDINGSPKLLPRRVITAMNLESKDWLLDPEIMTKAHHMRLRILEFNVFGRLRGNGISHVHMSTCRSFVRTLLYFRFSKRWRRHLEEIALPKMPEAQNRGISVKATLPGDALFDTNKPSMGR